MCDKCGWSITKGKTDDMCIEMNSFDTYSKVYPDQRFTKEELAVLCLYLLKQLGGSVVVDIDQLPEVADRMLGIGIPDLDETEVHIRLEA